MITRPFDLVARLSPPPRDFNAIAWVNVGVIVLFFGLLGSRFVLAPGLLLKVDDTAFGLPATPGLQNVRTASVVVGYRRDDIIMFNGAIITLAELRERLTAYAKQHPGEVLLLLADRQVSVKALADLAAMAQSVGFAYVQIAAEPQPTEVPSS
jgi:biopolymer transport protein ExbD